MCRRQLFRQVIWHPCCSALGLWLADVAACHLQWGCRQAHADSPCHCSDEDVPLDGLETARTGESELSNDSLTGVRPSCWSLCTLAAARADLAHPRCRALSWQTRRMTQQEVPSRALPGGLTTGMKQASLCNAHVKCHQLVRPALPFRSSHA